MTDPSSTIPDAFRADAIIAGTLCLMSCYVQHPVPLYAERVAGNLNRMADCAALTPELRTICRRLSERWDALQQAAGRRIERGECVRDDRALH